MGQLAWLRGRRGARKRSDRSKSLRGRLEALESRALLTTFYVDNNLLLTADRDSSGGLSPGDQVTFGNGQTYQQADLTYAAAPVAGDVGTAFNSIAQALASPLVQAGDTIDIAGGTYTEAVTIDMSLSLQGEGDVVIQAPTAGSGTGISINANSGTVTLSDLDLEGFGTALSSGSLATLNLTNVTLATGGPVMFSDPENEISNVTNLNVVDTSSQPQTVDFEVGPPMGLIPYLQTNSLAIALNGVTNISVTTGSGSDTFNVAPIAKTITIDGGDPTPPAQPGDTLNMWLPSYTGNSLSVTKDSGGDSGTWSFAGGDSVQFSHIETLSPGVLVDGYQTFNATQGGDTGQVLLAQFTDPLGDLPLSDYSTDIDWTDGTTSSGTVSFDATTGVYSVYGDHVFGRVEGSMAPGDPGALAAELKIVIHRTGSPDTTTYATAIVARRAPEVFYVDQNLKVTDDRDRSGGLSPGDQVTFGSGQSYQQADLTYDSAPVDGDVGTAFNSIGQALASPLVQAGDSIDIAGGTYTEGGLTLNEDLTLEGEGNVVIAAPQNASQPGLSIIGQPDSVTIKNLNIQGFQTSLSDAGGGTLTLVDVGLTEGETSISNLDNLDVVSDTTASEPVSIDIVRYAQPLMPIVGSFTPPANGPDTIWAPGQFSITFSGVRNLSFATGAGVRDTISVSPLPDTAVTIDGNDSMPPGAPGDTLEMPTNFVPGSSLTASRDATGLSGTWTVSGYQPVNFSHIASLSPGIATQTVPPITGTHGVDTGSQVVAQFTVPAGDALPAGDTAEIYWQDSFSSAGTISYDASTGVYSVLGSHTYVEGGIYTVSVRLNTPSGVVLLPDATANITPTTTPSLTEQMSWTRMPTVGQGMGPAAIATFTDGVHLLPSDYSAEVDWGDGTSSAGSVSYDPGSWIFEVTGDHVYSQTGVDDIVVTIKRDGVVAGTLTATAIVSDQLLTETPSTLTGTAGVALGGTSSGALVADFEEGLKDSGTFQATIEWGDGTTTSGTVVEQGDLTAPIVNRLNWAVFGSHTYEHAGNYQIDVSLTENGVFDTAEASNVTIVAGNQGSGNQGTGNQGTGNQGSGDQGTGDQGTGNQGSGDQGTGDQGTGDQGTGDQGMGDQGMGTPDQAFVTNVYHDLLNRSIEPAGLAYWMSQIEAGLARSQFVAEIEASGEYRDDVVTSLYEKYLHRAAEPAALDAGSKLLAQGTTDEQLTAAIVGSDEYFALHGGTNDGFVSALFQDAFGRPVDAGAMNAFKLDLAAGRTRAQVAASVFGSQEYHADLVGNLYLELLNRTVDAPSGAYWAAKLDAGAADGQILATIAASDEFFKDAA